MGEDENNNLGDGRKFLSWCICQRDVLTYFYVQFASMKSSYDLVMKLWITGFKPKHDVSFATISGTSVFAIESNMALLAFR